MATIARNCGTCTGELPADASFCPKCGTPTPIGIDRQTGVIDVSPAPGAAELEQHRKRLQQAVGASVEIRGLLGRGGFAEVFVGWDVKLRRELAIKTLRSDLSASGAVLERFQREAQAIAGLRHPNIIPIYNVGEGDGIAYFSMPRVAGESLAGVLEREGQLDVVEACRILREAASALAHAHRAGVIHRDIKPENIMLEGAERSVLVMDVGIAKSTSAGEGGGLTGKGTIVGSPQYMSPEQATGERQLDARSDQYSLAMVGYAILTGRLPFEADSVQSIIF
jgi:serine/threonine protein kinase